MPPHTDDPVDLLIDADPGIRLATVMQLGEEKRRDAAAAIVERFARERDFQIREALTWAALRVPDDAIALVRKALVAPQWLARLQATHTISKLGLVEDAARLVPVIGDPVDCVAARAYWAAAQCGDPLAVPALISQLGRGTPEHRNSLLVALSSFHDDVVVPLVQALTAGATADVREHAADTLAYLGAPYADSAEHGLKHALHDDTEAVRLAALNALGQLRTTSARSAIESESSTAGKVGVLARRLVERCRHAGRPAPPGPQINPHGHEPIGRSWPPADLSLVQITDKPLGQRLRPMLAAQVAICNPTYLTRADVPDDVLADVRQRAHRNATATGRSQLRAARIAAGHVELFVHEHVFHEQVAVADPGHTIDQLLYGTGIKIIDFDRGQPPTLTTPTIPGS